MGQTWRLPEHADRKSYCYGIQRLWGLGHITNTTMVVIGINYMSMRNCSSMDVNSWKNALK
jgi:hypothetical protein